MKTIEVTDEQFEALKHMAGLLKTQNNRITEHPIFCIYQKVVVPKPDECGEEGWADSEGSLMSEKDQEDAIQAFKDSEPDDKLYADMSDEEILEEYCGCKRVCYEIEDVVVDGQYYFTEESAQRHIDQNHYHYHEPFTFVESAWRNPEWELIRKVLMESKSLEVQNVEQ